MAVLDASAAGVFSLVGIDCMWRWSCCYVISRGLMGWAALLLCVDKAVSQVFEPVTAAVFQARFKAAVLRLGGVCVDQSDCGWVCAYIFLVVGRGGSADAPSLPNIARHVSFCLHPLSLIHLHITFSLLWTADSHRFAHSPHAIDFARCTCICSPYMMLQG
jgi:hypothetical protein